MNKKIAFVFKGGICFMNKKIAFVLIIIGLLAVSAVSAQNLLFLNNSDDSMYQVSLMQAFMHGEYDGVITVGDLKTHGDIGLGTFEGVNGEMIVLDGVVYQAAADGSIKVVPDNETIPFATITRFNEDQKIPTITRSVEKQEKPYKEFTDVAAADQKVFNHTDQTGTVVAVYFPKYMNELNMHGWHLHYLSDDKTKGGHVLGFNNFKGSGQIDEIHEFKMILPTDDSFAKMNFTENMTSKISSVE